MKLLQSLTTAAPPRTLTAPECQTLAHYSGWGDSEVMQRLFPQGGYSWTPICKENDRVRRHLAEYAELLAAVRLPAGAFAKTAGTEVIADVALLRKRSVPTPVKDEQASWLATEQMTYSNGYGAEQAVSINCWFTQQPHLRLGRPGIAHRMHNSYEFELEADGRELADALQQALIAQLPKDGFGIVSVGLAAPPMETNWEAEKGSAVTLNSLSGIAQQRASLLLDLYTAAKELIQRQLVDAGDEAIVEGQRELNMFYRRFTARYGFINAKQNLRDLDRRSPLVPFLRALEEPVGKGSWKKTALFTQLTIRPNHRVFADKLVEFYQASKVQRGMQLVFCDLATPKAKAAK